MNLLAVAKQADRKPSRGEGDLPAPAGHSGTGIFTATFFQLGSIGLGQGDPIQLLQRRTLEINLMNESSKTPLLVAFVVVVVLFLIFGGGAMTGSMMSGGMMGHGWIGGFSWIWIPTLLTLGLGVLLGWLIFAKK